MTTPPPLKNPKRDFSNVEQSPDSYQKYHDELKAFITSSSESTAATVKQLIIEMKKNIASTVRELIDSEIKKLLDKISKLEEEGAQHSKDIASYSSSKQDLSARINQLEQDKLNNSIEITGICPAAMNSAKSAKEIASQVLSVYDVQNFKNAYKRQITTKTEQKKVLIVTFNSYGEKMDALNKKRTADMEKKCSVYFNHSLTSSNRSLYMHARIIAKSLKLKVAISLGRVFIRHPGEVYGNRIKSQQDLENIKMNKGINKPT